MSLKEKVNSVLKNHNLVHLATIDGDGNPCVRGVDYASVDGEASVFIITQKDSRKVQHIRANSNVAFAIDHDCPTWDDLQKLIYLKGTGTATIIEDPEGLQNTFGLLLQKFPFLKDLPGEPSDFVGVRVDFKEVLLTDNTVQFGHTETVNY